MANEDRKRRNMTDEEQCGICSLHVESTIHLFRDCPDVKRMWKALRADLFVEDFFSTPMASLLRGNLLTNKFYNSSYLLNEIFAVGLWWTWKWRNEKIFRNKTCMMDRSRFVQATTMEYVTT